MAGFSTGFLVVISTHVEEIGREQFCAKLFDNELHCIAHSPEAHLVASCGDHRVVKVIDMHDWKETKAFMVDKDAECLDSCAWADSGKILRFVLSSAAEAQKWTRLLLGEH
jgi:WD repeat-containing protein 19